MNNDLWIRYYVAPKNGRESIYTHGASEFINVEAMVAGYNTCMLSEREAYGYQCIDFLKDRIEECDPWIGEQLEILEETYELED